MARKNKRRIFIRKDLSSKFRYTRSSLKLAEIKDNISLGKVVAVGEYK